MAKHPAAQVHPLAALDEVALVHGELDAHLTWAALVGVFVDLGLDVARQAPRPARVQAVRFQRAEAHHVGPFAMPVHLPQRHRVGKQARGAQGVVQPVLPVPFDDVLVDPH